MKKTLHATILLLFAIALCFLSPLSMKAAAGYHWQEDYENNRIQYINDSTGEPVKSEFMDIKGYTYYFDQNGYACTGFTKVNGYYYYFRSDGSMVKSGWIANRYFMKNGRMAVNRYVKDKTGKRSYVGSDGRRIDNYKKNVKPRFIKDSKGVRYRDVDGKFCTKTWKCIKGQWYYFYSNGYMAKKTRIGSFYVDRNGRMVTRKWVKIGNYKYYYGSSGRLVKKVRIKKSSSTKGKVITVG